MYYLMTLIYSKTNSFFEIYNLKDIILLPIILILKFMSWYFHVNPKSIYNI